MSRRRIGPARSLAGMLAATGVLHIVAPKQFDTIVPRWLPGPRRRWTYLSGAAELGVAAAVAAARTRRWGGLAAAALFVAVFPANVQMALDADGRSAAYQWVTYARLPLQVPLVVWAVSVARSRPPLRLPGS